MGCHTSCITQIVLCVFGHNNSNYFASWNGATQITDYEIHAGPNVASMTLLTTTEKTGFETAVTLTNLDPDICVFKIRPKHTSSNPMPFSNVMYRLNEPDCFALLSNKSYFPVIRNP